MLYLSKSKYCDFWQCPKKAWLNKYKPELQEISEDAKARMETGNAVGDLAMGIFGDFVEVTTYNEEGKLDLSSMLEKTQAELARGTEVICEASFSYDGLYCAVDILRKENNGYSIYEVKSSTTSEKKPKEKIEAKYIADISYQKYVLEHCGINVTGTYLVTLNKDYILDGEIDLSKLFNIINMKAEVDIEIANVEGNLLAAKEILLSEEEPKIDIDEHCSPLAACPFKKYCTRHISQPSVFDLYNIRFKKAVEFYKQGISTYADLLASNKIKNEIQLRQIEYHLNDKGTYVDVPNTKQFLGNLSYPIYFLDFESILPAVPMFNGTKPYQNIPFQYSLHFIEKKDGELQHREFLGKSSEDPRRAIAESLCRDIPRDVCVIAYNKSYECGRIQELAKLYPDLQEHLLNISEHVVDLIVPFRSGYYYNKDMGGSFSIKSVLPALFPNDPSLNYDNLQGVHNGTEAMTIYPKMKDMTEEEQEETRKNLLKYCELDTYAMVKIWEVLVKACEDN